MDEQTNKGSGAGIDASVIRAEPRLLGTYLDDHLAGSVGGAQRFERVAELLRSTPVGPALARVAGEVAEESGELREVVQHLDLARQNLVKQAVVWVGERAARLRAPAGLLRRSPITVLLEVELLRAALVGKLGVWETLRDLAPSLELDEARCEELRARTLEQVAALDRVHAYVRLRALAVR